MNPEKREEFANLFEEFAPYYPYTGEGLRYRTAYEKQRKQGRRNFQAIAADFHSEEDIAESVLLQLLPHADSITNRQQGAWVHVNAAISEDLSQWWQKSSSIEAIDRPILASAIFNFICRCWENSWQLSAACHDFFALPNYGKFQMEMLTPILNAILPDRFILIGNNSLKVINYFAETAYSEKLIDYPPVNVTAKKLIETLTIEINRPTIPALREEDLFDMFSHWLVAVKKYDFSNQTDVELKNALPLPDLQPEYSLNLCAAETGFEERELKRWIGSIKRKKQAILQGPPGTGKTFLAQKLAKHLIGGGDGFWELIQFHPAYTYEDFIQGIRPNSWDGELTYQMVPGRFLEFCQKAASCLDICVLIVDEINRANLSLVFGELMYLLEYRDRQIPLAGSGELFAIPENALIIATMNTADRSIALVDNALRRRFAFISLYPNYELLRRYREKEGDLPVEGLIEVLEKINREIGDRHYYLGISFFLIPDLEEQIEDIWQMEIEPYLEEYFYDRPEKVEEFRWGEIGDRIFIEF
ncbi:MAG: AAA family ATPase [Cyanobacteriota bacterium]|nr:AAA family ATPase [Cyanobacteriota bacterium]